MKLVIAEKPAVGKAIAQAIGVNPKSNQGYIQCENITITWCSGHLLQMAEPHDYNPQLKQWNLSDLPFFIRDIKKHPVERTKNQLKTVVSLTKQANTIYHCGDPDDEGQLIVDEILDYVDFKKTVMRVFINDNNLELIKKAFNEAKDNSEFRALGYMALARSYTDWHFGLNLTRAFTTLSKKQGEQEIVTVGRVQDAIKGLIVRRCREIDNFKKTDFYSIYIDCWLTETESIKAEYLNEKSGLLEGKLDDYNRIVNKDGAEAVVTNLLQNPSFIVINVETQNKEKAPPLPYNLLKLQIDMSRKFDISLDETLAITQRLRDNYNAITYNRSDCQYLNDETFKDAPNILNNIAKTAGVFEGVVSKADSNIKSKCFNSSKTSAHHAIIPTLDTFDINKLTPEEKNCYLLICRAFIAQFYSKYEYSLTTYTLTNNAGDFIKITSKLTINDGWMKLYKNDSSNEETQEDSNISTSSIELVMDNKINLKSTNVEEKQTKPPKYYTEATLAGELTRVAQYIKSPELRKVLIEKDKDKADEHGGIGTPATRGEIIKNLKEKGFFILDKKKILATDLAYRLYDQLPDQIKYPDLTAIWHEDMKNVKSKKDAQDFCQSVMREVTKIIESVKVKYNNVKTYNCPTCNNELLKFSKNNSKWWACAGFKDKSCNYSCGDLDNTPTFEKAVYEPQKPKATTKKRKFKTTF